jgi:predicted Holliday junction resolvase-like endonuclease
MTDLDISSQFWIFIFVVAAVGIAVGLIVAAFRVGKKQGMLISERTEAERIERARKDAVERSRAVLSGQISEQIAPWLPDFPVNPSEARFIGKPVDFVAFSGVEDGNVHEVIFIEVKTGRSALSPTEKSVKDAIIQGHVRWVEYRIDST